jgi:pyruvate/2-oxoglutarate dehydrogenase complex dihydrolipoamide acyltransferase (E2) component
VVVAPVIRLCVTFDHRVMDGKHASHMSKTLADVFAQPEKYFGKP